RSPWPIRHFRADPPALWQKTDRASVPATAGCPASRQRTLWPTPRETPEDSFTYIGSLRRGRALAVSKKPTLPSLAFLLNHFARALPGLDLGGVYFPTCETPP